MSHLDIAKFAGGCGRRSVRSLLPAIVILFSGCSLTGRYNTVEVEEPNPTVPQTAGERERIPQGFAHADMGHSNPLAAIEPARQSHAGISHAAVMAANLETSNSLWPVSHCTDAGHTSLAEYPRNDCCPLDCSARWHQAWCGPPPALNFRSDLHHAWHTLGDDAKSTLTWKNLAIIGAGAGAAVAIHQDWDGRVRDYTAEHPNRWSDASKGIGYLGDFTVQIPALAGLYTYSLWDQNYPLHDLSGALISAYSVTTTTTTLIKVVVDSDRPSDDFNGGRYGFPSYHTSSSFALASVIDEYYGHEVGVPAYVLAGVIGWTRIDERDHDLSDVVFGAVLGTVIGKTIARRHLDSPIDVLPYYDPQNGTSGVSIGVNY